MLSGNRNFEGRINPDVKANYLASPPLVVAYALAGTTAIDLVKDPIGTGGDGRPVFLSDIWPTAKEVADLEALIDERMFASTYANVFEGNPAWNADRRRAGRPVRLRRGVHLHPGPALLPGPCPGRPPFRTSAARASWPSWATP